MDQGVDAGEGPVQIIRFEDRAPDVSAPGRFRRERIEVEQPMGPLFEFGTEDGSEVPGTAGECDFHVPSLSLFRPWRCFGPSSRS